MDIEPVKRGRGRPPGSSNKSKQIDEHNDDNVTTCSKLNYVDECKSIIQHQQTLIDELRQQLNKQKMQLDLQISQLQRLDVKLDLIWSKFTFITPAIVEDLIMLEDTNADDLCHQC